MLESKQPVRWFLCLSDRGYHVVIKPAPPTDEGAGSDLETVLPTRASADIQQHLVVITNSVELLRGLSVVASRKASVCYDGLGDFDGSRWT